MPGVGPAARTRPRGLSPVSFTLSAALTVGKRRPFGFCSLPYLLPASRPRDRPRPGRRPRCESAAAPELGEGSEAGRRGGVASAPGGFGALLALCWFDSSGCWPAAGRLAAFRPSVPKHPRGGLDHWMVASFPPSALFI